MQRDCVIIGGGIMGCTVGLRLAQAGVQASILERAVPGAEASSAAAGILSPQGEEEHLGDALRLALASRDLYSSLADELRDSSGIDIGYRRCGAIRIALDPPACDLLAALAGRHRDAGLSAQMLDGQMLHEAEPALSSTALSGVRFPDDAQLEPRELMRALAISARRAGCEIVTGRVIRRVLIEHDSVVGIETDGGVISCGRIVIAAGSWSGLIGGLEAVGVTASSIRPARGQLVELDLRQPILKSVIFGPRGYLVPRPDGRIIAGSTLEFVGFDKTVTAGGVSAVLQHAIEVVPQLEAAPITAMWSGLRPHSSSGKLLIGSTHVAGLALATGHFRNGILLAPVTAEMVVDHLLGRPPRYRSGGGDLGADSAS
jgi:glycine oxidase